MRRTTTSSVILTSLLCISGALSVQGYLLRTQQLEDAAVLADDFGTNDDGIDVDTAPDPDSGSLTGRLLVAAPGLEDPYFQGTVIYMLADDDEGSLGVVLNRPRGPELATPTLGQLWDGGPVGRDRIFVLHDDLTADASVVIHGVAVAADPSVLDDTLEGRGPDHVRVFVGYAGWGPGQLDRELRSGAWLVADTTPETVLSNNASSITRDAYLHAR